MPDVLDLVEPGLLERSPPRRLPPFFLPNLIGEYLLERPLRSYLDPFVLAGLAAAITLAILQVGPLLWAALLLLLIARLSWACFRLYRDVREDYLLLRHGVVVGAHVIGVRVSRDIAGNLSGAYLDCAIPISRKRTHVGSVWIPDPDEAARIGAAGWLPVLCLTRAPGIWRLRDGDGPRLRYEPAPTAIPREP